MTAFIQTLDDLQKVELGIMPFGKFKDNFFEAMDDNYIKWLCPSLHDGKIHKKVKEKLWPLYEKLLSKEQQDLETRKGKESEYYGNIGDQLKNHEMTVVFAFWMKARGLFIITMVDNEGRIFLGFHKPEKGGVKYTKGQTVRIDAVVNNHREYRGQKQTGLSKMRQV